MLSDVSLPLAFAAGVLSFLSPCILPLIPSYVSYISGVSLTGLRDRSRSNTAVFLHTLAFVGGFTVVFVALGILFAGTFGLFSNVLGTINLVAGLIVIVLGLNIIFDFWRFVNVERRFRFARRPRGFVGSSLLGMAFGAGWTPCIGPILSSILIMAGSSGRVGEASILLAVFSLGLGAPFLAAGLAFDRVSHGLERIRRLIPTLKTVSGVLLILIGLLLITGRLTQLNVYFNQLGLWVARLRATNPLALRLGIGALFLLPAVLILSGGRREAGDGTGGGSAENERSSPAANGPGSAEIDDSHRRRHRIGLRAAVGAGFVVVAVASIAGVVDLSHLLTAWLSYQGL